jgi:L-threonylcarbamoyladenylate synthase
MNHQPLQTAWKDGLVCLHPTDTLPGLSFDPRSDRAWQRFLAIKQRAPEKSPIALIADWAMAERCWMPLPPGWDACLQALWPASLSVVWKADGRCPKHLLAADATCSLRMPDWSADTEWMRDLLLEINTPFPSSSVNRSGDPAIADWDQAVGFLQPFVHNKSAFVPLVPRAPMVGSSSTLIRIEDNGDWTLLRPGTVSRDQIEREVKTYVQHL